ncbi:MAG: hypothetical protein ACRDZZ_11195 [Ilumatobacteraceae bacterium]
MRQIFTVRFFAAVGALLGLVVLLSAVFRGGGTVAQLAERSPMERRIDLVALVFSSRADDFTIGADGITTGSLDLVIDAERTMRIVPGTRGEANCDAIGEVAKCAVVADLLGDGVVWFAIVPLGASQTVELPAIVSLDDGFATLANGWQLPYAPILERRCAREFESFTDFREQLGTDFVSVYSLTEGKLTDVVCNQ